MRNAETEGFMVWLLAEAGTEVAERGGEVCVLNDVVASVGEHFQHRSTAQEVATALNAPVVYQTCDAFHCRCCKMQMQMQIQMKLSVVSVSHFSVVSERARQRIYISGRVNQQAHANSVCDFFLFLYPFNLTIP